MKNYSLILTLLLALIAAGCGGMFKGKEAADKAVSDIHQLFNEGKLTEIYTAGHTRFKGATTQPQFLALMEAVQRKLGKVTQTSNTGINIQSINLVTTVVLKQSTTFENGTGNEVFTFQIEDGKAVLLGYNINSTDLIVK